MATLQVQQTINILNNGFHVSTPPRTSFPLRTERFPICDTLEHDVFDGNLVEQVRGILGHHIVRYDSIEITARSPSCWLQNENPIQPVILINGFGEDWAAWEMVLRDIKSLVDAKVASKGLDDLDVSVELIDPDEAVWGPAMAEDGSFSAQSNLILNDIFEISGGYPKTHSHIQIVHFGPDPEPETFLTDDIPDEWTSIEIVASDNLPASEYEPVLEAIESYLEGFQLDLTVNLRLG